MLESTGDIIETGPRMRDVPAVTRAVAILRLLGRSDAPLGVNAIARDLGLVPSTCLHILRVLAQEGLVAFDASTKRYALDAGLLTIARSVLRRDRFADAVQPALARLSERYGVTAIGVRVIGLEHMVVVAIARSALPLRLSVEIGSRFPALISATGRCIGAFGGHRRTDLDRGFRALRWDRPPTLADWHGEIEQARRNGYSVDAGNYIRGVTIVAAPVLDRGGLMSHAVVGVGVGEQMEPLGVTALAEELRDLGRVMSAAAVE